MQWLEIHDREARAEAHLLEGAHDDGQLGAGCGGAERAPHGRHEARRAGPR